MIDFSVNGIVFCKSLCEVFCKKCEAVNVLILEGIWAGVLLLDCFAYCERVLILGYQQ